MTTKELSKDIPEQVATSEPQQNGFETMMPSIQKLLVWLIYITGFGLLCFPYLALTVEPKHSIHLWILSAIDFGLFLALLNFKRFVVGDTLQQNNDSADEKKQEAITANNNNQSKKQQNVQKKNKKE